MFGSRYVYVWCEFWLNSARGAPIGKEGRDWIPQLQIFILILEKRHVVDIVGYFKVADFISDIYFHQPRPK